MVNSETVRKDGALKKAEQIWKMIYDHPRLTVFFDEDGKMPLLGDKDIEKKIAEIIRGGK